MSVATQQVTTRLPEFQEQYIADLLTSAQNLFKPTEEGGKGLSMPFVQQQLADFRQDSKKPSVRRCLALVPTSRFFRCGS